MRNLLNKPLGLASVALILSASVNAASIPVQDFAVDYGSVSEISDLSGGGLRLLNNTTEIDAHGARISLESLIVPVDSNLLFDWRVFDQSNMRDYAYYELISKSPSIFLPPGDSTFHHAYGASATEVDGTVIRFLMAGSYSLFIGTHLENPNPQSYILDISNVRLEPLEQISIATLSQDPTQDENPVPDSSLGFLSIASILGLIGAHRRFAAKTSKQSALA